MLQKQAEIPFSILAYYPNLRYNHDIKKLCKTASNLHVDPLLPALLPRHAVQLALLERLVELLAQQLRLGRVGAVLAPALGPERLVDARAAGELGAQGDDDEAGRDGDEVERGEVVRQGEEEDDERDGPADGEAVHLLCALGGARLVLVAGGDDG